MGRGAGKGRRTTKPKEAEKAKKTKLEKSGGRALRGRSKRALTRPAASALQERSLPLSSEHIKSIPCIGFGTGFGLRSPELVWRCLPMALDAGYLHIDTGAMYGSERHVGDVLGRYMSHGRLSRSDVFLCTKVAHPPVQKHFPEPSRGETAHMIDGRADSAEGVRRQFCGCLERLGVGHVDLLLLHWPGPRPGEYDPLLYEAAAHNRRKRREMWSAMEELYERRLALAIGVSNFSQRHLEQLQEDGARTRPHVNQVELHPYLAQKQLVDYCQSQSILVTAYCPLARGADLAKNVSPIEDPLIRELARARNCSPAKIMLRWLLQRGIAAVPKASTRERMEENLGSALLSPLSADEMESMGRLDQGLRIYPDPETIP